MSVGTLPKFVSNPDPSIYMRGRYVVVDLETTLLDNGWAGNLNNSLVIAAWKCSWATLPKYSWGNEFHQEALLEDISLADFVVAQGNKFEYGWFNRFGIKLESVLGYDTLLGHYVLAGNRAWKLDLDSLADFYGVGAPKNKLAKRSMKCGICPSQWPKGLVQNYCLGDVLTTEAVFLKQRQILDQEGLLPVVYHRCLFTPVLAELEHRGMCLDAPALKDEYVKQRYRQAELENELKTITGGINISSTKQLGKFLYEDMQFTPLKDRFNRIITTKSGKLPTNEKTITTLRATNKAQRRFLKLYTEAKKISSAFSKFLTPGMNSLESGGMLYAQFSQTTARTHRLASTKRRSNTFHSIQLQNPPRIYKPLFRARQDGWKVVEVDFAGAEFASAGILTNDPQIKADIADPNFDIHTFSANTKFNLNLTSFSKGSCSSENRQDAKEQTFAPMYRDRPDLDWDVEFRSRYSQLDKVQRKWAETVLRTKQLTAPWGLKFYWPDCEVLRNGSIKYVRNIYNYLVQGFATAEWTPIAAVCLWHRLKSVGSNAFLVNTQHDSVVSEVPNTELEQFDQIVQQSFTKDLDTVLKNLYNITLTIPTSIEVTARTNWKGARCKVCSQEFNPLTNHECRGVINGIN